MNRPTITAHETLADAMLELHRQILARWGNVPEILDDLVVKTLDVPHEGSSRRGTAIVAYPRLGIRNPATDVAIAYYGDPIEVLDAR